MTVLIDSWTWIEYWRGGSRARDAADHIDGDEKALVSSVNLAELYHWVLSHYDEKVADEKRSTIERRCLVVPLDADLAIDAARLRRAERLALADSVVLATGRRFAASVITGDPDFRGKRGVVFLGREGDAPKTHK